MGAGFEDVISNKENCYNYSIEEDGMREFVILFKIVFKTLTFVSDTTSDTRRFSAARALVSGTKQKLFSGYFK